MFAFYWAAALVGLLILHYGVMPRLIGAVLGIPAGAISLPQEAVRRYYQLWSAAIGVFTLIVYLGSVVLWARAGYLGTFFFMAAPMIWLVGWLVGAIRGADDSQAFIKAEAATLTGSILGTLIGWGLQHLLS